MIWYFSHVHVCCWWNACMHKWQIQHDHTEKAVTTRMHSAHWQKRAIWRRYARFIIASEDSLFKLKSSSIRFMMFLWSYCGLCVLAAVIRWLIVFMHTLWPGVRCAFDYIIRNDGVFKHGWMNGTQSKGAPCQTFQFNCLFCFFIRNSFILWNMINNFSANIIKSGITESFVCTVNWICGPVEERGYKLLKIYQMTIYYNNGNIFNDIRFSDDKGIDHHHKTHWAHTCAVWMVGNVAIERALLAYYADSNRLDGNTIRILLSKMENCSSIQWRTKQNIKYYSTLLLVNGGWWGIGQRPHQRPIALHKLLAYYMRIRCECVRSCHTTSTEQCTRCHLLRLE